MTWGTEAAGEAAALAGIVVGAAEATGLVEAKRNPAPFRIKVFDLEN